MNYTLSESTKEMVSIKSLMSFSKYLRPQSLLIFGALVFSIINAVANIIAPILIGRGVDIVATTKNPNDLGSTVLLLFAVYVIANLSGYFQIIVMGRVGQNVLFDLRTDLFRKLQSLPLAFFNANKSGDLIARINNDTEKINSLLSEMLIRFMTSIFIVIGVAIAMVSIDAELGLITLSVVIGLFIITIILSPILQRLNRTSLDTAGDLSAQIQEIIGGFKIFVAHNKQSFAAKKFSIINEKNYNAAFRASIASQIMRPLYDGGFFIAIIVVLIFGIAFIQSGAITIGILVAFTTYNKQFYDILKEIASIWGSIQMSFASWTRLNEIFRLRVEKEEIRKESSNNDFILEFDDVSFKYSNNPQKALDSVSMQLKPGKTYALVGPTGGGKSTTASLIARLYGPTEGSIFFKGKNLQSYSAEELSNLVGFILQEPFMFTDTIANNIQYGAETRLTNEELEEKLRAFGLESFLKSFSDGLSTKISNASEQLSLGQKQIIAFLRILLREPELLILDEATANVDTLTENILEKILDAMPKSSTKIIIAHRLNTIENADEIFFISGGTVTGPLDFDKAVREIENTQRKS